MTTPSGHLLIYVRYLAKYLYFVRHVLLGFLVLLLLGAVAIAYFEDLRFGDSVYFAFITGLTVGYGDIEPVTAMGRVVSIAIALVGLLFTGITVAVATRALAAAARDFEEQDQSSASSTSPQHRTIH